MKQALHFLTILAVCVATASVCAAQERAPRHPLEPSDTSSPRATLSSFIDACNEVYDLLEAGRETADFDAKVYPAAERMLDCLDLSALPNELRDTVGVESAVQLKEVLDRLDLPADDDIPGATTDDGEELSRWRIPGTRLTIARVEAGPQQGRYLFTPETVKRAGKFYTAAKQLPYREGDARVSPGFHERYAALTRRQPTLSADTSSPRGTLTLFIDTTNELFEALLAEKHVDRSDPKRLPEIMQILSCLDLSEVPEYSRDYYAAEAAVCLKEVLDRVPLPPAEGIPGPEDLQPTEGGEPLLRWQIPNTEITIARMVEGPRRGEYLFSSDTVARAVALYENLKNQPYRTEGRAVSEGFRDWWLTTPGNSRVAAWIDVLPDWFRSRRFNLALWQWLGLLIAVPVSLGCMWVIYWVGQIRSGSMRRRNLLRYWGTMVFTILATLVPLAFKYIAYEYLTIRGTTLYVVEFAADLVFLLALIVVILAASNRLADSVVVLRPIRSEALDPTLIRIICRVFGIVAAVVVFLEGGKFLGFPMTTLLASAGIGGLAVALAAQGMVKGLFGTVTILLDRPYRVGDRIVVNEQDGVVEEIGLRSTKIREFMTDHVVSIPNDQMAETEIENIGRRKHIRRMSDLHIPLDTPRENIEKAIAAIRTVLANHEGMDPEYPPRVYFNDFNTDSFNIRVLYWYTPPELWNYYAFCENVNLEIFRAFEEQGIQFSLPLRHTFWKHDAEKGPLDVNIVHTGDHASSDAS